MGKTAAEKRALNARRTTPSSFWVVLLFEDDHDPEYVTDVVGLFHSREAARDWFDKAHPDSHRKHQVKQVQGPRERH